MSETHWIEVDEVIWKAGQFSRPPLTEEQLHNLRVRLESEREQIEPQRDAEGRECAHGEMG